MPPNARLAGLIRKDEDEDGQPLVPFVFAEVRLPKAQPGRGAAAGRQAAVDALGLQLGRPAPRAATCWSTPRAKDEAEMRFHVTMGHEARGERTIRVRGSDSVFQSGQRVTTLTKSAGSTPALGSSGRLPPRLLFRIVGGTTQHVTNDTLRR